MRILKQATISITTLCLVISNMASITFADSQSDKREIQNAINKTEAFMVTGKIAKENKKSKKLPEEIVIDYLTNLERNSTFKLKSKEDDKKDTQFIIRLQQYINNIPIYGSDVVSCISYDGTLKSISGYIQSTKEDLQEFNYTPKISKEEAINLAKTEFNVENIKNENIKSELYLYKENDGYKLAYKIDLSILDTEIHNESIFVDANDGKIINQYDNINNIIEKRNIKAKGVFGHEKEIQVIYKKNEKGFEDGYYLIDLTRGLDPLQTLDIKNQYFEQYYYSGKIPYKIYEDIKHFNNNLQNSDGKFVDAHYYVGKSYDFYNNKFNRKGFNSLGSKPALLVNVNNPGNAFYTDVNGMDVIVFGNGDSNTYDSSGSIDVVGHEYTHGVVKYTADFQYLGQSGAIDEAYGDIFGTLIEHTYKKDHNWTIGEDYKKQGYLRDMSNPQIDNVDKMMVCTRNHKHNNSCDNNYVHYNSGIVNKLAYLISEGGTEDNIKVQGIGENRMGEIFYDALTEGLYSQSDFKHLGEVLLTKTKNEKEKTSVENALKAVGIIDKNKVDFKTVKLVGDTRYSTAIKISQNGWDSADNVVIVNSSAMADALSATPFARAKNAPLLLTQSESLNEKTQKELKRLKAKNVYIVGGTAVVSDNVVSNLKSLGLKVERISGDSRYNTSFEVAKRLGNISQVAVVNGESGIPDAISIAPVAASNNMPIILSSPVDGTKVFDDYIKRNNIKKSYVIGGNEAVSNDILNKLPNAKRLGGSDRNETNAAIINEFYKNDDINSIYVAKDGMKREDELIDALSIGVLASRHSSPVLIVGNVLNDKQKQTISHKRPKNIVQVGGDGNEEAFEQIQNLYK